MAPILSGARGLRRILRETEALRMLRQYLRAMQELDLATPDMQRLSVAHVYDLVALRLGATRDAKAAAEDRGVRAARLRGIKEDVARNRADGDITASAIAARHRVSPRYLRKRLEQVRAVLANHNGARQGRSARRHLRAVDAMEEHHHPLQRRLQARERSAGEAEGRSARLPPTIVTLPPACGTRAAKVRGSAPCIKTAQLPDTRKQVEQKRREAAAQKRLAAREADLRRREAALKSANVRPHEAMRAPVDALGRFALSDGPQRGGFSGVAEADDAGHEPRGSRAPLFLVAVRYRL